MKSAKVSELESQATKLMEEKHKNEEQLSQLQAEFNSTKKDLGSTEVKLRGLVSMEKKCE
jgi:peptidoglycan hydrolase CwlO-like protein